jgi:phage shock protein PspC (stress-responsive transcriptional regulator)
MRPTGGEWVKVRCIDGKRRKDLIVDVSRVTPYRLFNLVNIGEIIVDAREEEVEVIGVGGGWSNYYSKDPDVYRLIRICQSAL